MTDRPLLFFQSSRVEQRGSKPPARFRGPPKHDHHVDRVQSGLDRLLEAIKSDSNNILSEFSADAAPEHVIVIRTAGTVDAFYRAASQIQGLEWLAEAEDEFTPDEDFYETTPEEDEYDDRARGQLYLTAVNQSGINQLLSLWGRYKADPKVEFPRGQAPWKQLFALLHDIRRWDVEDRLSETGVLQAWEEDLQLGYETVETEIILWFRQDQAGRARAEEEVITAIRDVGGTVLDRTTIEEIRYHAILAKLSQKTIQEILKTRSTELVRCQSIMFFVPSGQTVGRTPKEIQNGPLIQRAFVPPAKPESRVAILDGCPQSNHPHIAGHIKLDDPDGWFTKYQVKEFAHGTQTTSVVVNGDLAASGNSLNRPVYIRPIMIPDERDFRNGSVRDVAFPSDKLKVDLVYRAIRRIFEADGDQPASAPETRILCLSLGDKNDVFLHFLSPWAKLLDWASWKYGVLIFVSAGNHDGDLEIDVSSDDFKSSDISKREEIVLRNLHKVVRFRTLLSPAEGINILTVGACYNDASGVISPPTSYHLEVMQSLNMPAPYSARGLGFRRSVKPDILVPGGRILFNEPHNDNGKTFLRPVISTRAPGILTSAAGAVAESNTLYQRGTSLANALAVHNCAHLLEILEDLLSGNERTIDSMQLTSLLKAIAVHGASWGEAGIKLKALLQEGDNHQKAKSDIARHLGYGAVDFARVTECTEQRATIIGWGSIKKEQGLIYELPLPYSLSAKRLWRRLTITLGWITPLNFYHRYHRSAQLWFDVDDEDLIQVKRSNSADWKMVRKGTIQHEVFEGERAASFVEDDILKIKINCSEDAGKLQQLQIPFGIVASLEVGEGVQIPVYNELRTKLQIRTRVGTP